MLKFGVIPITDFGGFFFGGGGGICHLVDHPCLHGSEKKKLQFV